MDHSIKPIATEGMHEKALELALKLPGSIFLDAPTGHGALTQKLLDAGKQVTAVDIDIDKFMADRSHSHLKLMRLDLNEARFPFQDGQFDVVVSVEGIEHLEGQWSFIRNLCRVLKPGGHMILTTPNILNFRSRLRYFMEGRYEHFRRPLVIGKSWGHDLQNYHISPISFFELQFMLQSCGFSIQEVHTNRYMYKNLLSRLFKPLLELFYWHKHYRDMKRSRGDLRDSYKIAMSDEVFYGECLIIIAKKQL